MGEGSGAGEGEPSQFYGEEQNQDWSQGEVWERQAEEADHAQGAIVPLVAALGGADSGGDGEGNGYEQACECQLKRERVALNDQFGDALVEAERFAEVSVEDAVPVVQVLLADGD